MNSAIFVLANLFSPALTQGIAYDKGYACHEAAGRIPFGYEAMETGDARCSMGGILEGDVCPNGEFVVCTIPLHKIRWIRHYKQ